MGRKKKIKEITDIDLRDYKKPKIVLLFEDHNKLWVALCIQHNFVAQGRDLGEVMNNFEVQYENQVNLDLDSNIEPFSNFNKVSDEFLEKLFKDKKIRDSMLKWNFQYKENQ